MNIINIPATVTMPRKQAAIWVFGIVVVTALVTYHLSKHTFNIKFTNLKLDKPE